MTVWHSMDNQVYQIADAQPAIQGRNSKRDRTAQRTEIPHTEKTERDSRKHSVQCHTYSRGVRKHTSLSTSVVNSVCIQLPRGLSDLRVVQVETSIKLQHGVLVLRDLRTPLELPRHLIAARKAFPAIGGTKQLPLLVTSTIH